MPVIPFKEKKPSIRDSLFLAPDAWVTGEVTLGENVSLFFGAALRGDILPVIVGDNSNVQEHSVLHTSKGLYPCIVGNSVTVGHRAIIHGATVKDRCIIGMNSVLLDGAEIGEDSIVGAHSLVTMHKKFPPRSLIMGSPAKFVRELTNEELWRIQDSADRYVEVGRTYREYFLTS